MLKHSVKEAEVGASETSKTTDCRGLHPGSTKDVIIGILYARRCRLRRLQNHELSAQSLDVLEL